MPFSFVALWDRGKLEVKRIKEDNLLLICSRCSAPEPTLRCSACHAACYCTSECQKLHWGITGSLGHRAACAALRANGEAGRNDALSTNTKAPDGTHVSRQ